MPHLVQLDKRNKKKGLSIITVECQNSPKDAIEGVLKKVRADFPVTKGTTRPPTMQGIPHAVVFDVAGKLIFAGHPSDDNFDRTIKKALRDVVADSGSSSGSKARSSDVTKIDGVTASVRVELAVSPSASVIV